MKLESLENGLYLILYENEAILTEKIMNIKEIVIVNFGCKSSLKIKKYFKENQLKIVESNLISKSEIPNEFFSVITHLLIHHKKLIIGTAGISFDSIATIADDIKNNVNKDQLICFVSTYNNLEKKDYEVLDILNMDKLEITTLLKN